MAALRNTMDMLRDKLPDAAIILASGENGKAQFVVSVSAAAQQKGLHAGRLIKDVAAVCGGSGGGRADMAQAGGKENTPELIKAALQRGEELVRDILANA